MEENKSKKKIGTNQLLIIVAISGIVIGALIMFLLNMFIFNKDKTVASIKGYKVSKTDIYDKIKSSYGLSYTLEAVDNQILKKKYTLTDDMKKEIEEEAEGYITAYTSYGYDEAAFLEMYGFANKDEFIEDLSNNYRQELYLSDYMAEILGEDAIKAYYETDSVYGDINCKHLLVATSDEVTSEQAKALATTIISELKNGSSWDEVTEKYADKLTVEDLGYQGMDNNLESSFMDALLAMTDNSYSTEPVETSYGYHVIYRLDQKEKPSYENAKKDIVSILGSELQEEDSYLSYRAFMKLEEEYGLKIKDKDLKKQYDEFKESIKSSEN